MIMNQQITELQNRESIQTKSNHFFLSDSKIIQRIETIAASLETGEDREEAGCLHYLVKNLVENRTQERDRNFVRVGDRTISSLELLPKLMRYRMLPQLIKETIIDRAISNISCTPGEIELARQQFLQQHQITTEQEIVSWCEQNYLTLEELDSMLLRSSKIDKFKQAHWEDRIEPYFITHKKQLDRVCFSLIRLRNNELAQEIYFRLTNKEQTFAELAREYSLGSEAQTAGIIGPVPLSNIHTKIAQMLKRTQLGQILPPIQVEEWIAIVRLETFVSAQLDEQTRKELLNELFSQWLTEQIQQSTVDIFSEVLSDK